ncbi:MAG: DUF445 family protein [Gemmatimonadota bacterium]|jgi:uncharacterized membrane protein YheB (UPF0754 family)|nr:DUF445 family protein [Gemmatimonadota bacterium]
MEFLGLTPWEWLLPLIIGIVAGLGTNAVAIWMLFHPYRPVYAGPVRVLPMGAIPKEIDRIAKRIGETVGKELLTPEDIARTLSSASFRGRFDEVLRGALQAAIDRELPALRELVTPDQAAQLQEVLDRLLEKLLQGIRIYLASPEFELRVRRLARGIATDFRGNHVGMVLTPELHADILRAARELWESVRESDEMRRVIAEALDRFIANLIVSEKPLRSYVPTGAVNLGEAVVAQYLPILLERLGQVLDDPATRLRLQETLRRFVDRFLEEQQTWKRIVGRLVVTERTLSQTVAAIEQGGVEEISGLLRAPEVQARVAAAVNDGVEEVLNRPVRRLLGELTPERADRLRNVLVERVLYLLQHPTTEQFIVGRLDALLTAAEEKTVEELLELLGQKRAAAFPDALAGWIVETLRGARTNAVVERTLAHQTSWMMSVPIGRVGQYLPPDAAQRGEDLLFDPLWSFIQKRVPVAVAGLPIARMVEEKLKGFPIEQVEALIWRVSRNELVLIIYLGGFLGALIGSLMLLTSSVAAGLVATGFFLLVSFVFLSLKA